jgi:isocitrate lyase
MDTVPNKVEHLFLAQQFHDRKQRHERLSMSKEERLKAPYVDFLRPIVADADTGHGGITACIKLTKMFIERGAAGVHVEDQVNAYHIEYYHNEYHIKSHMIFIHTEIIIIRVIIFCKLSIN